MKIKTTLILFLVCFATATAWTQLPADSATMTAEELGYDTVTTENLITPTTPVLRRVSPDSLQALRSRKEFEYMRYADSFLRQQQKINQQEKKEPGKEGSSPGFFGDAGFRMLYWILAFAGIFWLLWQLFGSRSLFSTNKSLGTNLNTEATLSATVYSKEELILQALSAKNYRLATRWLYLHTLEGLGRKQMILLSPQKTNYQYQQELQNKDCRQAFASLTLQYEYIWFGELHLSEAQFNHVQEQFKTFEQQWA